MRNWMSARSDSLHEIIPLGSPVKTLAAGRIVESLDPRYPVGSRITAMSCWSEYDIIDTASTPQIIADGISAVEALGPFGRSEEHTSELQSLMRNSYAVLCLEKKTTEHITHKDNSILL